MTMTLANFRTNIKLLLGMGAGSQLSEAELDRSVFLAVGIVNRYFPRETFATQVWTKNITAESVTADLDVVVPLANKPIRFGSEVVTSSPVGTTYEKDTDYEMDYTQGTITALTSGNICDCDTILVSYERDPHIIDVSSLLTEPIAITHVDIRSGHEDVRTLEGWDKFGDLLVVGRRGLGNQQSFADNDEISIWYTAMNVEPGASSSGGYPAFLDELIVVGAGGYALLIEGLEREHQAVTDAASSRTSLGNIAALHTSIGTAFTALATPQGDINTALDRYITDIGSVAAFITSMSAEIALANTELDKYDVTNGPIDDAEVELVAAIAALADIDTVLDKVASKATLADTPLALVPSNLTDINVAADQVISEMSSSTDNSDTFLAAGEALINKINNSPNAPGDFLAYAQLKMLMAQSYAQEGQLRAQHGRSNLELASSFLSQAVQFINEATTRLTHSQAETIIATGYQAIAATHIQAAQGYIGVATGYGNQATLKINEAMASLREATERVNESNIYLSKIQTYIAQINTYQTESDRYQSAGTLEVTVARDMRSEGLDFLRSFFSSLRDRQNLGTGSAISSGTGYADYR